MASSSVNAPTQVIQRPPITASQSISFGSENLLAILAAAAETLYRSGVSRGPAKLRRDGGVGHFFQIANADVDSLEFPANSRQLDSQQWQVALIPIGRRHGSSALPLRRPKRAQVSVCRWRAVHCTRR